MEKKKRSKKKRRQNKPSVRLAAMQCVHNLWKKEFSLQLFVPVCSVSFSQFDQMKTLHEMNKGIQ